METVIKEHSNNNAKNTDESAPHVNFLQDKFFRTTNALILAGFTLPTIPSVANAAEGDAKGPKITNFDINGWTLVSIGLVVVGTIIHLCKNFIHSENLQRIKNELASAQQNTKSLGEKLNNTISARTGVISTFLKILRETPPHEQKHTINKFFIPIATKLEHHELVETLGAFTAIEITNLLTNNPEKNDFRDILIRTVPRLKQELQAKIIFELLKSGAHDIMTKIWYPSSYEDPNSIPSQAVKLGLYAALSADALSTDKIFLKHASASQHFEFRLCAANAATKQHTPEILTTLSNDSNEKVKDTAFGSILRGGAKPAELLSALEKGGPETRKVALSKITKDVVLEARKDAVHIIATHPELPVRVFLYEQLESHLSTSELSQIYSGQYDFNFLLRMASHDVCNAPLAANIIDKAMTRVNVIDEAEEGYSSGGDQYTSPEWIVTKEAVTHNEFKPDQTEQILKLFASWPEAKTQLCLSELHPWLQKQYNENGLSIRFRRALASYVQTSTNDNLQLTIEALTKLNPEDACKILTQEVDFKNAAALLRSMNIEQAKFILEKLPKEFIFAAMK
jgi:hypothetical protein